MYLNFIDILILLGASQSLFLSVIILFKYGKTLANRILTLMLFGYFIIMLEMLLVDIGFFIYSPHLVLIIIGAPYLVGPLYFLFTKYLIHAGKKFSQKDLLHFIPFVVYELFVFPQILVSKETLLHYLGAGESVSNPLSTIIMNWLIMFQAAAYTLMTSLEIRKYSKRIKNLFSSIEKIKLDWLRNLAILFSVCIITYIIENMLITEKIIANQFAVSSIVAALLIFVLGFMVLMKSEVFISPEFTEQIESVEEGNTPPENKSPKYEKSGLTDQKAEEYLALLNTIMKDKKPYLESGLTLNNLADMLSVSPHHLSEVINSRLNQNFFDLVNNYRVEKVKEDLLNPDKNNYTLLAIALDAGFNSKSSFNSIFRKHTGMTPSEFKKSSACF